MIRKNRLIGLTQKLIRINSENPPGNESRIAEFVAAYLKNCGITTRIYSFKNGRPNVLAYLGGINSKYSLLITPHLDTVPAGKNWKFSPFSGTIHKGRIYGLGATDCKGNLACAMEAMQSLREENVKLPYRLIFAATADEESGSGLGLIPLLDKGILKPSAAVVLDSDEFDIIVTQKGLIHVKVKVFGKRSHGAYPWRGVNAIDSAIEIIKEIKSHKFPHKRNRYLRGPTINVGTIQGGDKVNIVADWCEFELDFRFLPGMSAGYLLARLKSALKKHAKKFEIEIEGIQQPYRIKETHALVTNLMKGMKKAGVSCGIKGSEGATVITFFQDKFIPAVATGFGSSGCAHSANEYVKINNLYKGAGALEEFLKKWKG